MFLAILGILSFLDNCRVDAVHAPGHSRPPRRGDEGQDPAWMQKLLLKMHILLNGGVRRPQFLRARRTQMAVNVPHRHRKETGER
jgi:hypothetical protein